MAKLVFGMNQSLDGYVDHDHPAFTIGPVLFRYFTDEVAQLTGSIYGRTMYELMRYWDNDQAGWSADEHAFAAAWRKQHKWVFSSTLTSVGPNATLVDGDLEATVRKLKAEQDGVMEVAGTKLARSVADLGLIDEYRIYQHPVVIGSGTPYFAGPRPRLRFVSCDRIDGDVIRLVYAAN